MRPTDAPLLPDALEATDRSGGREPVWRFAKDKVELSLGELVRRGDAYAGALAGLGVGPGDRVGLVLENGPEGVPVAASWHLELRRHCSAVASGRRTVADHERVFKGS